MPYVTTVKQTRLDPNVKFYMFNEEDLVGSEVRSHFIVNYKISGKILNHERQLSSNSLELITTITWASKEIYNEFISDPYLIANYFQQRDQYNTTNNILKETISEVEV